MPQEQPSVQNLQEPEKKKDDPPAKSGKDSPVTFTWVLFGIIAIVAMWLLSSLWFK